MCQRLTIFHIIRKFRPKLQKRPKKSLPRDFSLSPKMTVIYGQLFRFSQNYAHKFIFFWSIKLGSEMVLCICRGDFDNFFVRKRPKKMLTFSNRPFIREIRVKVQKRPQKMFTFVLFLVSKTFFNIHIRNVLQNVRK